jgi:demethylmenaquinone methyltransferase/2-methoxy-6-polyprenyl-1,4-benzoquinol methylase
MPRPKGYWYLPGRLYDLAFRRMFRALRRRVCRTVEKGELYPWLDVCCGTGDQFRGHVPDGLACGLDKGFGFVRYAAARARGVPFVCGDASRLPFKDGSMRAVSISFGLHDKSLELRTGIMAEARRVLAPGGELIAVDFENPWDKKSKMGMLFTKAIERFASREHYRNGREFLKQGGLKGFLSANGFVEVFRRDVQVGSVSVVAARPGEQE